MSYSPDLFPNEQQRIVPHDEGMARLSAIKHSILSAPEPEPSVTREQVAAELGRLRQSMTGGAGAA